MRRRGFKPYVQILKKSHWTHYGTLARVKEALQSRGLEVVEALRKDLAREGFADGRFGLVVVVGGDGTFLDASHWTRRVPVLGVNSDPTRSVARFSGCEWEEFGALLDAYGLGRVKPLRLPRLSLKLNGKPLKWPILNDVLVAAKSPAATSRYILRVGARREEQMSSGVWVSTAAGSTAANQSAGGRVFSAEKPVFQYVVREPFARKFGPRHMLKGVLGKGRVLEITSTMREGMIYMDGPALCAPFALGDTLRITLSAPPLSVIGLKK
jgi:NAD+ kinase